MSIMSDDEEEVVNKTRPMSSTSTGASTPGLRRPQPCPSSTPLDTGYNVLTEDSAVIENTVEETIGG